MTALKVPRLVFISTGVVGTVVAGHRSLLLGVACFLATMAAHSLNGISGILESYRLGPADADNPMSPVAIARIGRKLSLGFVVFLCAMSLGFGATAVRSDDWSIRSLSAAFAIVALAAGPFSSIRRRAALWTATGAAAIGTVVSLLPG